jgi:putative tryptophan/tyrosine transport system substrate-binding protein
MLVPKALTHPDVASALGECRRAFAGVALFSGIVNLLMLRDQLVALAARSQIPAVYEFREFVVAGGLCSYGTNNPDVFRQLGFYAARVLKG